MSDAGLPAAPRGRLARLNPRRWPLWQQPAGFIAYVLTIDAVAAVLTAVGATQHISARDVRIFVGLALLGFVQAEFSRHIERVRRRISGTSPHINMTSVWTFAGVLLLPPVLITALVVVLYLHLTLRSWLGLQRAPTYRVVGNVSLATISSMLSVLVLQALGYHGIGAAMGGWTRFLPIAGGAVAYFVIAALIVLPGIRTWPATLETLFGTVSENLLEFATLCLGAMVAVAIVAVPGLSIAVLPPVLLLQRSMLVTQLEVAATIDDKTGMLNAAEWRRLAEREVARAMRAAIASPLAVLMIDLDHFKSINDRFGHLVGDRVLKSVATVIATEVRDDDAVGRFGGEEFVVLLPGTGEAAAQAVAERIRIGVGTMSCWADVVEQTERIEGLSVSIGIAMYPVTATDVDELVQAADMALYQAKRDGRNRIATSPAG